MARSSERAVASWYDRFYEDRHLAAGGPWYDGAVALLGESGVIPGECRVIEVGCGNGGFLAQGKWAARVGTDLSFEAATAADSKNVPVFVAAAEHLPLKDNTFDVVVCCEVLEHVQSPA